ncbi:hypothetical protein GI582_11820 [Sulfitobacter sp. BDSS02]|nr:hypothetical protein [Sulfitobacter sp. BDSS02]MBR9848597.1 hypothetical protein [Paracoccaceae bacterium]
MSAVNLLGKVICHGGKVCVATFGHDRDVSALLSCGLLREAGVVSSVVCMDCENAHAAEVIFDDGAYGHFCPDLGFVNLERQDIAAVEPDLPALIEHLAETFACARRKTTPVYGNTWRIGAVKTDHGDITLYFHPRLRDAEDARELADALSREIASAWRIVVTACGRLPVFGAATLALVELVTLSPTGKSLDPAVELHAIVGVPASAKTGAPNRFREKCMTLIKSRLRTGQAMSGRNEEAKAVHELLNAKLGSDAPSLPTVKAYVTKARSG